MTDHITEGANVIFQNEILKRLKEMSGCFPFQCYCDCHKPIGTVQSPKCYCTCRINASDAPYKLGTTVPMPDIDGADPLPLAICIHGIPIKFGCAQCILYTFQSAKEEEKDKMLPIDIMPILKRIDELEKNETLWESISHLENKYEHCQDGIDKCFNRIGEIELLLKSEEPIDDPLQHKIDKMCKDIAYLKVICDSRTANDKEEWVTLHCQSCCKKLSETNNKDFRGGIDFFLIICSPCWSKLTFKS